MSRECDEQINRGMKLDKCCRPAFEYITRIGTAPLVWIIELGPGAAVSIVRSRVFKRSNAISRRRRRPDPPQGLGTYVCILSVIFRWFSHPPCRGYGKQGARQLLQFSATIITTMSDNKEPNCYLVAWNL